MAWTYEIDPAYNAHGEVPPEAIIAGAPRDDDGNIVGPWQQNPNYRPSVLAKLLKKLPSDEFLLAFGEYLRGEMPTDRFTDLFHRTEFEVLSNNARNAPLQVDEGSGATYSIYTTLELFQGQAPPSTVRLSGSKIATLAQGCEGLLVNRFEGGAIWLPLADAQRGS